MTTSASTKKVSNCPLRQEQLEESWQEQLEESFQQLDSLGRSTVRRSTVRRSTAKTSSRPTSVDHIHPKPVTHNGVTTYGFRGDVSLPNTPWTKVLQPYYRGARESGQVVTLPGTSTLSYCENCVLTGFACGGERVRPMFVVKDPSRNAYVSDWIGYFETNEIVEAWWSSEDQRWYPGCRGRDDADELRRIAAEKAVKDCWDSMEAAVSAEHANKLARALAEERALQEMADRNRAIVDFIGKTAPYCDGLKKNFGAVIATTAECFHWNAIICAVPSVTYAALLRSIARDKTLRVAKEHEIIAKRISAPSLYNVPPSFKQLVLTINKN